MSSRVAVRRALNRLLGPSGYQALVYHVRKLSGMSPEDLFFYNPLEFYRVLFSLFGQGVDFFVEALLKILVLDAGLPSFETAEAVRELREGKLDKIIHILTRLEEVARG